MELPEAGELRGDRVDLLEALRLCGGDPTRERDVVRRLGAPRDSYAVNGPAPVDTPVRPPPTCTRAILGPRWVRRPRELAETRTPGAILKEKKPAIDYSHTSPSPSASSYQLYSGSCPRKYGP